MKKRDEINKRFIYIIIGMIVFILILGIGLIVYNYIKQITYIPIAIRKVSSNECVLSGGEIINNFQTNRTKILCPNEKRYVANIIDCKNCICCI